jgi:hypothetical protein
VRQRCQNRVARRKAGKVKKAFGACPADGRHMGRIAIEGQNSVAVGDEIEGEGGAHPPEPDDADAAA